MAKKNNSNSGINVFSVFRWIRPYLLPVLAATFLTLLCLVIVQRVERFLFQSPRFALRLPGPDERGSPNLRIAGIVRVPAQDVRRVFLVDSIAALRKFNRVMFGFGIAFGLGWALLADPVVSASSAGAAVVGLHRRAQGAAVRP